MDFNSIRMLYLVNINFKFCKIVVELTNMKNEKSESEKINFVKCVDGAVPNYSLILKVSSLLYHLFLL